jgi:HSP20 family protein
MYFRNFMDRDPWTEMDRIQRKMNRLFNTAMVQESGVYPAINLWSNSDKVLVTAEIPGYDPKEIQLSIMNNELNIAGKRKPEEVKQGNQYHRQERTTGSFQRNISLPFTVESNKIEAHYLNGILSVTLPRAEADKPKKINIKTN